MLAKENECRVLLDTHLTEDLLQEGQIRELIRTIQETRKKWQLPVEQYISLSISTDAETVKIIQQYTALLHVIQAKLFDREMGITFIF